MSAFDSVGMGLGDAAVDVVVNVFTANSIEHFLALQSTLMNEDKISTMTTMVSKKSMKTNR